MIYFNFRKGVLKIGEPFSSWENQLYFVLKLWVHFIKSRVEQSGSH